MGTHRRRGLGRRQRPSRVVAVTLLAIAPHLVTSAPAAAGPATGAAPVARSAPVGQPAPQGVPGGDAERPRILFAPDEVDDLRDRLGREPYRSLFLALHQRTAAYDARHQLGDPAIVAQRDMGRAAKNLAFQYALDRTVVDGEIVPFPDATARAAVGDRVRDLLLNLYPRSRMAVPPPIGGWDRDINTSEEIVDYATAFDTLLGGGYDLGEHEAPVADRLGGLASELHTNFVQPETAGGAADLMQNNHRTKVGAALAIVAVALAGWQPPAGGPGPQQWFDYGVLQVDDVLRFMLMAGDGAYGEGPYYYRYTAMNLLPYVRMWERHIGEGAYRAGDVEVPSPSRHPLFARTQRWMLDTTVPDGTMAPIDDANPGRSMYFGAMPTAVAEAAAAYWRWPATPQPYETDGSVELGPDTIVAYDEGIVPTEPWWAPTQFYTEGGTATLRSDWSGDAVMALVLGEHDTASEFGRDRLGVGRAPQSHEHPDAGSFLMHAFGERLALDPGYLTFATHGLVNKPQDHNTVLVDGQGPPDYLLASFNWLADPLGRPPAEGQSTLHDTLDGAGFDATSVATWYRDTEVGRRFLMADDRYLVIGDRVRGSGSSLSWMQHGNGGGTSGGSFAPTPVGGRWQIGSARLDTGVSVADQAVALDTFDTVHEIPFTQQRTHTAVRASVPAGDADAVQVFYPTPAGAAPPTITDVGTAGAAGLELVDAGEDRRVLVRKDSVSVGLVDEHLDGSLRLAYGEGVSTLTHDGVVLVQSANQGTLGVRVGDGQADVVAQSPDDAVTVGALGFDPVAVDGACGLRNTADGTVVQLNRERRFTLRSEGGNARPAADAGVERRVMPGDVVTLDGSASCDADGDDLQPHWELVSAPAGSAWELTGSDSMQPQLHTDRVGPYRVRLTVTDSHGATSLEQEVLIIAGQRCGDGMDNDFDGRIDTDDADCDGLDPGEALISVGSASVVEGDEGKPRSVQFAVTLAKPSTTPVTVRYAIEPEGSVTEADFKPKTGLLTFKPNANSGVTPTTRYVSTKVFPDFDVEGDETFRVTLSEPSDGYVVGHDTAVGTIVDDDPNEDLHVSIGDATIVEGDDGESTNRARVRVTLNRPTTETLTVQVTIEAGTATPGEDFKPMTKTLTFKPGQWQKSIAVAIYPETIEGEGTETVLVRLSNPGAGLGLGRAEGTVQIIDDD